MPNKECANYYKFWLTGREPRSKKVRSQPALKWYDESDRDIICLNYNEFLENFNFKGVLQCLRDGSLHRFMEMCAVPNIPNRIAKLSHSDFQTTQSVWNLIRLFFQVDISHSNKDKENTKFEGFKDWLDIPQSKDAFLKARVSTCAYLTTFFDGIKFLYENKDYIHNPSLPNSDIDWKRLLDDLEDGIIREDKDLSFFYGKLLLSQGILSESDDMLLVTPQKEKKYHKMPYLYYNLGYGYILVEEAARKGLTEAESLLHDIDKSSPTRVFWNKVNEMRIQNIAEGILSGRTLPAINEGLKCSKDKRLYIEQILDFIFELKCIVAIWQEFKEARISGITQQVFSGFIQECEDSPKKFDGLNNYTFHCAEIVRELMTRYKDYTFPNMPFYRERKFVFGLIQQVNQRPDFIDFSELAENYLPARWMCETHKEARLFRQSSLEDKIDLIIKNLKIF